MDLAASTLDEAAIAPRRRPDVSSCCAEWPDAAYLACVAVLVLATYAPVYSQSYLATDDYAMTERLPLHYFLAGGRPLQGLAYRLFPREPVSLDGFQSFRLLATLGVVGLAIMLWYRLPRLIPNRFFRLLAVASITALPPLQIVVAWVCCWPFPLAALLAGGSACLLLAAGPARQRWQRASYFAAAAVLHVTSLCIYQPAGMWFWTIVLIDGLSAGLWDSKQFRRLGIALVCGLCHIGLYYLLIRGWQSAAHVEMLGRGATATDLLAKLTWFVNKPLVFALGAWNLYRPFRFVFIAIPLLMSGACFAARRQFLELRGSDYSTAAAIGRVFVQAICIVGFVTLAYLPNLAVAENAATCRTELALGVSVVLMLFWAIRQSVSHLDGSGTVRRIAQCGAALACLAALVSARSNIVETIIRPQQREYQFVLESLDENALPAVSRLHMICPRDLTLCAHQWYDEFGMPSSTTKWGAAGMLRIALRERGWLDPLPTTFSRQPIQLDAKSVLVVDMNRMRGRQR